MVRMANVEKKEEITIDSIKEQLISDAQTMKYRKRKIDNQKYIDILMYDGDTAFMIKLL